MVVNLRWAEKGISRYFEWAALAVLTLIVVWPGFQQGLGYIPEEVRRVAIAVQMAHSGDLNPHWFGHPASLLLYCLSAIYKSLSLASAWGALGGTWADLRAAYLPDPAALYLIGRGLARIAAVVAVIATLEVGARFMARPWALTAAALTAINPVFITNANRLRSDHILTFFMLLGVLTVSKSLTATRPERRQVWSGVLSGLAITYKYLAGCILVAQVAVLATLEKPRPERCRLIFAVIRAACIASFVASPFLWLDLPRALRDVFWEATKKKTQWNPLASLETIAEVIRYGFGDLAGLILLGVAVIALWKLLRFGRAELRASVRSAGEKSYPALILILLIYLGSTMLSSRWNGAWLAPVVPFFTLILIRESLRGLALLQSLSWPPARARAAGLSLMALLVVVTVASQLSDGASIRAIRSSQTVMERSEAWIEKNVPPGSRILLWQPVADQDGFFPRIRVEGATLLRLDDTGARERVCEGETIVRYETAKAITKEKCFPRPRVRSQSPDGRPPALEGLDFLITSSRLPPAVVISGASGEQIEPVADFAKPLFRQRLAYPTQAGFPEGDYGMWRHIRIYSLRRSASAASS